MGRLFEPSLLAIALALFVLGPGWSRVEARSPLATKSAVQNDDSSEADDPGDDSSSEADDPGDGDGHERKIDLDALPAAVRAAVEKTFPKGKMLEADVETEKGRETYDVTLMSEGERFEMEVSESGKVLEVEKDKGDDDDHGGKGDDD